MERSVAVADPFDHRRTFRGLGVGEFDEHGAWWWAASTQAGPSTLRVERVAPGVRGVAWGPGGDELLDRLPALIGCDDDGTSLRAEGLLGKALEAAHSLRLGATSDVHAAAMHAVLGQVVTTTESTRSHRAMTRALGETAPGPRPMRTVAPPHIVAGLSYDDLHSFGVERRRADIIIEVARRSSRLDEILSMGRDGAYRRLEAIRGIGPWTSALIMGEAWGDRDAVPVGDYHLPNMVAWAIAGEDRADDERMLELLEPYRPHRRRVLIALKQAGVHAPRYGPKTPVRRHL